MALKWGTNKSEKINGSPDDDEIFGFDGEDLIFGFKGKDHLDGGKGDDELWGGDGDDTLVGGDDDDVLLGGDGADVLDGGNDDDALLGGAGADVLDGGNDIIGDLANYRDSPAGVTVNLETGTGSGGDAEGDILLNIEQLAGSDFDDFLTGDDGANYLSGGAGKDVLMGGDGADDLRGGDGDDILVAGFDTAWTPNRLSGGSGNDTLCGDVYNDYLDGGDDNDIITGGAGDDEIIGGTGRDSLVGGSGMDTFVIAAPDGGTFSLASDPDHILDFNASARSGFSHDWIDMPTSEVYFEATNGAEQIGYNAGYDAARNWVEDSLQFGPSDNANVFVTDGVDGYLFGVQWGKLTTGVVLEGVTDFDPSYII